MLKKLHHIVLLLTLSLSTMSQNYPFVLGYAAGEQIQHNGNAAGDTATWSFSGGAPFADQWTGALGSNFALSGFRHDIVFAENGFNKELFASKGYFGDYVELRWELERYASQVSGFRIFRKEVGSSADSTQVANLASTERNWQDQYAESGTMYEYTLWAEGIYPIKRKFLNIIQGIGFRVPVGRVSGRVTYAGGTAVQGVNILAETQDNFSGGSIYLNGTNAYLEITHLANNTKFDFDSSFTFQSWYLPDDGAGVGTLLKKGNQYSITHNTGQVSFAAGSDVVSVNFTQKADTFFNITAMRTADSLILYVIYSESEFERNAIASTVSTPSNDSSLVIGRNGNSNYLKGYVDEVRIWRRTFSKDEILPLTSRYIEGTENNLTAYYRLNEAVGEHFYDLSRKGFSFNEHHGYKSSAATWDTLNIPFANQLSVKGVTDNSGNYIISGIPYSTNGSLYKFVPVFGVHSFNPNDQILFIGPGSSIQNNVNFTDVASFTVTGEVYYKDTYFPVEGVSIRVDGQLAVTSSGTPITTNSTGTFTIDVPIGQHYIQLEKLGHGFENNGRFPANDTVLFDFQQPYTFQERFKDTTLIKVVGKVAGGPIQAEKPVAMGKTTNNLGQGTIVMTTQKSFDLTNSSTTVNKTYDNTYYSDTLGEVKAGVSNISINATSPKQISISPDPANGEYTAYLLPEKYTITSATAGTYTYPSSFHTTLDLTNAYNTQTDVDSVLASVIFSPTGDTLYDYKIDSAHYNKVQDFIYRTSPSVTVTNPDDSAYFWEEEIALEDTTVRVVNHKGEPLTQWPIFIQREEYKLKISVFESYDNGTVIDRVPVTDGVVQIQNALALDNATKLYQINDFGIVNYKFNAGLPNTVGDLTHSLSITALTGKGGAIQTQWQYTQGSYTGPFKGYVFGGLPTGNNFITAGPNRVRMILRDPYGSESYSWFEQSQSVSQSSSYKITREQKGSGKITFQLGAEVKVFAGVGAGTITETEYKHNIALGIEHSETWTSNESSTTTTTATEQWQTSNNNDFVGAGGDVFIGNSTNIVYGISDNLTLIDTSKCAVVNCATGIGAYSIGIEKILRVNPKFNTAFQYSQYHIKNNLIPNLKKVRNLYLDASLYHTSHIPIGNPEYGKPNDPDSVTTTIIWSAADNDSIEIINGNSYSFQFLQTEFDNQVVHPNGFVDSVFYYNTQIRDWEGILHDNEKEKLEATQIRNLSFDAGATYTSSESYSTDSIKSRSFSWALAGSVAGELGFSFNKFGVTVNIEESYSATRESDTSTQNTYTNTFGYQLADGDQGDYLSIDVKQPSSQTGPVFSVRGGQSKCPYIDVEKTSYYQPGTILSQATAQREVPQILCPSPVQVNVPEDIPANFTVQLGNISQTEDDAWFLVSVDGNSNQNGARITMDGIEIGNGLVVFVPASKAINKIISIETGPDSLNYQDIGIILSSDCESSIADTITLTARFTPVCSKVAISDPLNQWVRNTNTGDSLTIVMEEYNLAHSSFAEIAFQYKPSSSSLWITDQSYYLDSANIPFGSTGLWIDNQPSLTYIWDMSSLPDRNYDLRAITYCAAGGNITNTSQVYSGIKDTKRPQVFGTPQPGNGILSPGEDVMLSFDEEIEAGLLLSSNFSVTGVLNGADISHSSSIYFDGIDDYASAISGVNLTNKSFTIEFWTKKGNTNQAGVLFDQKQLQLGFNASNQFYVRLGSDSVATIHQYTFTDKWIHFTISYDVATKNVNVYSAYQNHNQIELQNQNFPNPFVSDGRMYVGNNSSKTLPYNGLIHDLRVWEKAIGYGTANSQMTLELTGDEIGLSGFWPMNELRGGYASDLARSHHAIMHGASWRVEPSGYARDFSGTSTLSIPTASSLIITDEMDFTIEFWFRGGSQSNTVLFSNGKGDGTEPPAAFGDIWNIGFNGSGNLYAKNNAVTITDVNTNYLNNEWHHFALVLRRKGNTSMYVNGELVGFASSSNFGGLFANSMAIGSNRHYINGTPYANHFTGSIDEFRAWNLARTSELIELDMHNKLTGEEKGLVAYYPFDKYDINLVLQPTLKDNDYNEVADTTSSLTATAIGGSYNNTNVPLITDARPVQNLAFNWVVNKDQIIINLLEPDALLEKQVITFTADRIEDLRENRMASPETWTAFIRKNTVLWDQELISAQKQQYDTLSFNVGIVNHGGLPQNYTISNLPSWLTISSGNTGSLLPATTQNLKFMVDPALNIGTYEETVYLTSDFGYDEPLYIRIKVEGNKPIWHVNPAQYQYSMNVIGMISVDKIISTDEDDMLVAIVNDTVRGLANLAYNSVYDHYAVHMDVYSNVPGGETIDFWVWDASSGKTHTEVTPSLPYTYNTLQGTPSSPQLFEAINTYYEPIPLAKGWNWISFNLNSKEQADMNLLMASVDAQDGDLVKSQTQHDQYTVATGWAGSITSNGGIETEEMYKMKVSVADTIDYVGSKIHPDTVPIAIDTGWNWIGFVSSNNLSLDNAFSNYDLSHGDFIKGQLSFAVYDSLSGWIGNLSFMKPHSGYMFKSVKNDTLIYPDSDLLSQKGGFYDKQPILNQQMDMDPHRYKFNMNILATSDLCEGAEDGDYTLLAKSGNELRGVSQLQGKNFYLTTYGNGSSEELTFTVIDKYGNDFDMQQKMEFVPNGIAGLVSNPYLLLSQDTTIYLCDEDNLVPASNQIYVYPNPFGDILQVELKLKEEAEVQIDVFDITGRHVAKLMNGNQPKGNNSHTWEVFKSHTHLPAGLYSLRISIGADTPVTYKIVKSR